MMKRFFVSVLCFSVVFQLVSCGGTKVTVKKSASPIHKVAVVSFAVSEWAGTVTANSVGSESATSLIDAALPGMLSATEAKLGKIWKVSKVSGFISNRDYSGAAVKNTLSIFVPTVKGKKMPVFTNISKEIKGSQIDPAKAKLLCSKLKVDAVVLVFSEWSTRTGSFVPTTKALAKNIVAVWDRDGNMVFHKRVDLTGEKTLGAFGTKAVNKDTILQWAGAYERGLDAILADKGIQDLTDL